jgi:hypothetical protein
LKFGAHVLAATCVFTAITSLPATALAQPAPAPPPPAQTTTTTTATTTQSNTSAAGKKAAEIVSQPARDVGMSRTEIPPMLVKASQDPYGLSGLKACRQLASEVKALNDVLGPDFQRGTQYQENRMAKLAQAGGKTVVNSFIPFRGLVREVTGAAPADRKHQAAVEAGYARRGFLRGVYLNRNCRPRF